MNSAPYAGIVAISHPATGNSVSSSCSMEVPFVKVDGFTDLQLSTGGASASFSG